MPLAVSDVVPSLKEPIQITSSSWHVTNAGASSSKAKLSATPSSPYSCRNAFAIGSVFRVASRGLLKRSKGTTAYVSRNAGVVVIDIVSQKAVASYNIPPSALPNAPPLVINEGDFQVTFQILSRNLQESHAELQVWIQNLKDNAKHVPAKLYTFPIDNDISSLHPLPSSRFLAQYADGSLALYGYGKLQEPDLKKLQSSFSAFKDVQSREVFHTSVFDYGAYSNILKDCAQRPSSGLAVIMSAGISDTQKAKGRRKESKNETNLDSVRCDFLLIESDGNIRLLGTSNTFAQELNLSLESSIIASSLHYSGHLVLSTADGTLVSTTLAANASGMPILANTKSLQLSIQNSPEHSLDIISLSPKSILATFAHSNNAQASVLLIDTELGAVLAENDWKVREGVSNLYAHRTGGSSITVITSPSSNERNGSIYLWSIGYENGDDSHLRWSFASKHLTKRWLLQEDDVRQQNSDISDISELNRASLLKELTAISTTSQNVTAMSNAYFGWYKSEITRIRSLPQQDDDDDDGTWSESDEEKLDKANQKKTGKSQAACKSRKAFFPYEFVVALVKLTLPTPNSFENETAGKSSKLYVAEIIRHLLDLGNLKPSATGDGRLLERLWDVEDWQAILKALKHVDSHPEEDLIKVLKRSHECSPSPQYVNFAVILSAIADGNLTRTKLRQAMKDGLDQNLLPMILITLEKWFAIHSSHPLINTDTEDEQRRKKKANAMNNEVPSLHGTLLFATDVLDTFFPVILTTNALHDSVTSISTQVQHHMFAMNALGVLRAPLAAFARLEADQLKDIENQKKLTSSDSQDDDVLEEQVMGLRKALPGKRDGHIQQNTQTGGGTMTKYGLPEKTRRRQIMEENVTVGPYSLEQFDF